VEGHEAIHSGKLLAEFLNKNFAGVMVLSFASHSPGARVVLQTISSLSRNIRRVLLMAAAIDNNCLTNEYANATTKIDQISILASTCDDVLAAAFPLGNPIQGIIDSGHPYYHAALGREGPAQLAPLVSRVHAGWQIPKKWNYGHLDYMPGQALRAMLPQPCDVPPPDPVLPSVISSDPKQWNPAFSAGFATCRYK